MSTRAQNQQHRSKLCEHCTAINIRQPFHGPQTTKEGTNRHVRILYAFPQTFTDIRISANLTACHLCHLIIYTIDKFNARDARTVVDDWEMVDMWSDDEDEPSDSVGDIDDEYFLTASSTIDDIDDPGSPILLDFTFREPMFDEIATRCVDVVLHWTNSESGERLSVPAFNLVAGLEDNIIEMSTKRDFTGDTNTASPWSTSLSKLWMEKCNTEHEMCCDRTQSRQLALPTRVIDVGNEKQRPFLVESSGLMNGEYACLSHCWGKSQPFKTEVATLSDRLNGFELSDIPCTFCDAIKICRNLAIRYLWIDSLCIVQDSADDWAKESAVMGKIYRDASLTIFADFAESDADGCFMPRNGKDTALCRTPMFDELSHKLGRIASEAPTPTFVQAKLHHAGRHAYPKTHHLFETVVQRVPPRVSPLNSRGWVLQESVLSFRSLVYDQFEVRWTCPQMRACECLPESQPRITRARIDGKDSMELSSTVIDNHEFFNSWSDLVQDFAGRRLTFSKDKLPALTGLATEMATYNRSIYLAGLWRNTLRKDLSWYVPPQNTKATIRETVRPSAYRAPSWSWASIEGRVTMVHERQDPGYDYQYESDLCCEILDCKTEPVSDLNPFGEVKSGYLILRGHLASARCGAPVTDEYYVDRVPVLDERTVNPLGWFDPDVVLAAKGAPIDRIWLLLLHTSKSSSGSQWLALMPANTRHGDGFANPANTIVKNTFVRVGMVIWRISNDRRAVSNIEECRDWCQQFKQQTIVVL